jgi:hypothetical protein
MKTYVVRRPLALIPVALVVATRIPQSEHSTQEEVHHPLLPVLVRLVLSVVESQDRVVLREHGRHEARPVQVMLPGLLLYVVDQRH